MTSPIPGPPPDDKETAKERTKTWLKKIYRKELGREYDEAGAKHWIADIHERGQTRGDVVANIRRHDEWKTYQEGKKKKGPPLIKLPIVEPDPEKPKKPKYDYTPDPNRKYNKYWDSIDAAADAGNRMTDDYYGRFLPQMRSEVLLGINEIGAADRYHGGRYEGKPPTYTDPKELFDYYKSKTGKSDDSGNDTIKDLQKRIKELEDKYSIK